SEDLFAKEPEARILRLDQRRLDEITVVTPRHPARHDSRIAAAVLEILSNLRERLLVDDGSHEVSEIRDIAHANFLHDRDGALANFRLDRLGDVNSAHR